MTISELQNVTYNWVHNICKVCLTDISKASVVSIGVREFIPDPVN